MSRMIASKIIREYKSLKPKIEMCLGCQQDFYNDKNVMGIKRCWHFKDARVVDLRGYGSINEVKIIKKTLSCYSS